MQSNEEILTNYMRQNYNDLQLVALLDHAGSGQLSYFSCTCFIGLPPAVEAGAELHGKSCMGSLSCKRTYASEARRDIPEANAAEDAFFALGASEEERRAKLIPLIRAEIDRRSRLRSEPTIESLEMAQV